MITITAHSRRLIPQWKSRRPLALAVPLALILVGTAPAHALEWNSTYTAATSLAVSSNSDLEPDDQAEESATLRLSVGSTTQITGRRLTVNSAGTIAFIGETNQNDFEIDQDVRTIGQLELWQDRFFIDGSLSSSRELRSRDATVGGGDTAGDQDARDSVTTISLSPYWVQRFGRYAESELRYRHTEVIASGATNDSRNDLIRFQISGGRDLFPWTPAVVASWSRIDEKSAEGSVENDVTQFSIALNNTLRLSRHYSLLATIGYDDVDTHGRTRDRGGFRWSVGAEGRPGPRSMFRLTVGQRYEGLSINGEATYKITPRLQMRLFADQSFSTGLQRAAAGNDGLFVDPVTGDITGADGLPPGFEDDGLDNELSLEQVYGMTLIGNYGKNSVLFGGTYTSREFDDGSTEVTTALRGTFSRQLNRKLSGTISSFVRNETGDTAEDLTTVNGRLNLTYQFGERVSVFASYGYTQRFSDSATAEYSEHVGTIGGRVTF